MIANKFIHFKTYAAFNAKKTAGEINNNSIVFIQDTKQVYTHGTFYDCNVNDETVDAAIKALIANDLVTNEAEKALSAAQGVALKALIDALEGKVDGNKTAIDAYTVNGKAISSNPVLAKGDIGLDQVTNDAQVKRSEMGVANGVATLNENGKVPVSQLDGAIARVFGIEKAVANQAALPPEATEGDRYYTIDTKKIYEKLAEGWDEGTSPKEDTIYNFRKSDATGSEARTNILYRWDGENLVEISSSLALGETAGTAYEGNKGAANRAAIEALPTTAISQIANAAAAADSVTLNVKKVTKSGMNYGSEEDANVTIPAATQSAAGVMTATDKTNLDTVKTKVDELVGTGGEGSIQDQISTAVDDAKNEIKGDAGTYTDLGKVEDKIEAIDAAAANYVLKTDIINDVTTGGADKVLSAEQGKLLSEKIVTETEWYEGD